MNRIQADDPRLSAYVLDELGADERKEVEALIADSPEAQAVVAELAGMTSQLEGALAAEAAEVGGLGDTRRESIQTPPVTVGLQIRRALWLAAACVAAVFISVEAFDLDAAAPDDDRPETAARLEEADVEADADAKKADGTTRPGPIAANAPEFKTDSPLLVGKPGSGETSGLGGAAGPDPTGGIFVLTDPAVTTVLPQGEQAGTTVRRAVRFVATPDKAPVQLATPGMNTTPYPSKGFGATAKRKDAANGATTRFPGATGLSTAGGLPSTTGNTEAYDHIVENSFLRPTETPLSTLSIDVDTAAYANVRRFLDQRQRPPAGAVRLEELINYFTYDDPAPTANDQHPVKITTEVARCWWNLSHKIVRVGLRAKDIPFEKRPFQNLVFLIDVSGSMQSQNKLPLLKDAFKLLVNTLGENDRISIVVYASATGVVLEPTTGDHKDDILKAIDRLQAGGSTNGEGGIRLAYQTAIEHFVPGGNNRVILATDGDFNVGVSNDSDLVELIQDKARSGVFLSVLGFGTGNLKDSKMEKLADKGNGNYSYIDSVREAEKVLVREIGGTLITVAKDVKLQVEFNPGKVAGYRLLGYENRLLEAQDFNDDEKDAGEMGAGHSICALYEVIPAGIDVSHEPGVDPLKYQPKPKPPVTVPAKPEYGDELLTVKVRYKQPDGNESTKFEIPVKDADRTFDEASRDLRWSSAVAAFGMVLRGSRHKGTADFPAIMEVCAGALGDDPHGDRKGFVELVTKAAKMLQQ